MISLLAAVLTLAHPVAQPRVHLLGRSWDGRLIRAYEIGNPEAARKVLVVGCIHGNEGAGLAVARALALRAAPRGADVWIVPNLNPDGFTARKRQNAHGVDLNRNFPYRWRRSGRPWDTVYPGPRPLSERESGIVARLILRLRPTVSIWYHQHQNLVRGGGGSAAAARRYARLAGMRYAGLPVPRGAATGWQVRRFSGSSAFVVELPAGSLSGTATQRHARAVLALAAA
ncbi:MAG: DUF2817 domain-containing protein [Actinomycetota bacterium]|nr:DUF2817 domain-containing protein [Actinomycetota bacterium]